MTVKLVVLYTQPDDPDVFDATTPYTHADARPDPGLQRARSAFHRRGHGGIRPSPDGFALFRGLAALEKALVPPKRNRGGRLREDRPAGSRMLVEDVDA